MLSVVLLCTRYCTAYLYYCIVFVSQITSIQFNSIQFNSISYSDSTNCIQFDIILYIYIYIYRYRYEYKIKRHFDYRIKSKQIKSTRINMLIHDTKSPIPYLCIHVAVLYRTLSCVFVYTVWYAVGLVVVVVVYDTAVFNSNRISYPIISCRD